MKYIKTYLKNFIIKHRLHNRLSSFVFSPIESLKDSFATYHLRPRRAANIGTRADALINEPKTAIVIQGGLTEQHDFTLETIRLYKKHFPNAILILSTWEGSHADHIKKIREERIEIIESPKPSYAGISNVNLQIISSQRGLERAKSLGAQYALKTRTDQRMYSPVALEFLRNILKAFPLTKTNGVQKERIVSVSLDTFKYRLYGVSDMLVFGHIDDMLLYWTPKLDMRKDEEVNLDSSIKNFAISRVCEVYFATEFLKKVGHTPTMTLMDSWYTYATYFCIVDYYSIDLYWPKYKPHTEHRYMFYDKIKNSQILTFAEWFNLQTALNNKAVIPEKILEDKFGWSVY